MKVDLWLVQTPVATKTINVGGWWMIVALCCQKAQTTHIM